MPNDHPTSTPRGSPSGGEDRGLLAPGASNAQLVYILYLLSFAFGITYIIAAVMAYMSRGGGPDWVDTHYTYAIHTFWLGLLYSVIAGVLTFVFIGFVLIPVVVVWFIIRCVKGILRIQRREPIDDPRTWLV